MRITAVDPAEATGDVAQVFTAQTKQYGAPLNSSTAMARRPSILLGYRALDIGMEGSGLLPAELKSLVNRRVASHNDCPF